jgi:biotin carboxyl carrier protein
MRREVLVNGEKLTVDMHRDNLDWDFRIEERDVSGSASILPAGPGVYSVLWNGKSYRAQVIRTNGDLQVAIGGITHNVEIIDPREVRRGAGLLGGEGRQTLAAPMPGKVVKVLSKVGDEVLAGQGIVVVEAMKMQNEMKTTRAGKVISLSAVEGATVNAGDVLAVVE